MKTLFRDGMIITMNSRKEILQNSDLLIEEGRIQRLLPGTSYSGNDVDHVIDCKGKIILPGLISAHTHLTGMLQRGLWDEASFETWSQKSGATEKVLNLSPDDIHSIHSAACIELIRHGVTTVLNMFTMPSKEPLKC